MKLKYSYDCFVIKIISWRPGFESRGTLVWNLEGTAEEPIPIVILKTFWFFPLRLKLTFTIEFVYLCICVFVWRFLNTIGRVKVGGGTLSEIWPSQVFRARSRNTNVVTVYLYRSPRPYRAPSRPFDKPSRLGSRLICATTPAHAPTRHGDVTSACDFESPLRSSPVALRRTFISRIIRLKRLGRGEPNEKPNDANYTSRPYTATVRVSVLHNTRYSSHPWPTIRVPNRFTSVNLTSSLALTMRSPLRWKDSGLDFLQERRTYKYLNAYFIRGEGCRWTVNTCANTHFFGIIRNLSDDTVLHERFETPLAPTSFARNLLTKIQVRKRQREQFSFC